MKNKTTKPLFAAIALSVGLLYATTANANLVSALGGQVVNDTDLNITWLADANYAKTSGYAEAWSNGADGQMNWDAARMWAANLSLVDAVNNITYDNWRLPTVVDTGTPHAVGTGSSFLSFVVGRIPSVAIRRGWEGP